jgi:hypothetical protein
VPRVGPDARSLQTTWRNGADAAGAGRPPGLLRLMRRQPLRVTTRPPETLDLTCGFALRVSRSRRLSTTHSPAHQPQPRGQPGRGAPAPRRQGSVRIGPLVAAQTEVSSSSARRWKPGRGPPEGEEQPEDQHRGARARSVASGAPAGRRAGRPGTGPANPRSNWRTPSPLPADQGEGRRDLDSALWGPATCWRAPAVRRPDRPDQSQAVEPAFAMTAEPLGYSRRRERRN